MDTTLIIILVLCVLLMLVGAYLISLVVKKTIHVAMIQKEEIMNTKPKRRVEYVDTFFSYYAPANSESDGFNIEHLVKDIDSKEIFSIDEVNSMGIKLEVIKDKVKVKRYDNGEYVDIKPGDQGYLWVDESVKHPTKSYDGKTVKIGKMKFTFAGSVTDSTFKGLKRKKVIYNINKKNDISLYVDAKSVYGILSYKD